MYLGPSWVLMLAVTCLLKGENSTHAHTQLDKLAEKVVPTLEVI